MRTATSSFRAMGTDVRLIAPAGDGAMPSAAAVVRTTFEREERRCSRFRADSELSRVNARAGSWTAISPELSSMIAFALEAARRTQGRVDPTILPAVVAAGYDRDLDEVLAGARHALRPPRPCGRWPEVQLGDGWVRIPPGAGLDLGGFAKGWTVDLATEAALGAGLPWALVNAGGDLRVVGAVPEDGIEVALEDPEDPHVELGRLRLFDGALATSSVTKRAWGPGRHHLIDPRTGDPAEGPVLQATAWAPTCAEAEVCAKDALLGGEVALERAPVVLVLRDGSIHTSLEAA